MFPAKYPVEQTDPPRSPKETLPTMYDLPSEDPEEPGLPDEYHYLQPQLLSLTFRPAGYPPLQLFSAGDLNLYYDPHNPNWYKRPDWFAVVDVPRLYEQRDLRLSYVVWQEGVSPFVVVELLSPGTEKEDLGQTTREVNQPPSKWFVYEQILRIPYYVVFDRYTNQLRGYALQAGRYQELDLQPPRVWMPAVELGLGVWQGVYQGIERQWLRWYDAQGNWISTEAEAAQQQAEIAEQRAEIAEQRAEIAEQRAEIAEQQTLLERQRLERLAEQLRAQGIEPEF